MQGTANYQRKVMLTENCFFSGLGQFYNVPPIQSTSPIQFHSLTTALLQHRVWCHWPFEEKQMILLIAAILRCILLPTADNDPQHSAFTSISWTIFGLYKQFRFERHHRPSFYIVSSNFVILGAFQKALYNCIWCRTIGAVKVEQWSKYCLNLGSYTTSSLR